jgi:hypothetical protein
MEKIDMVDFGILSTLRNLICSDEMIRAYGLFPENIYISPINFVPGNWPAVFIELEEIWNQNSKKKESSSRVVLGLSILSNKEDGLESLNIANCICRLIDGISFDLRGGYEATFRMKSSVVDLKKTENAPRKVEQCYEAFVKKGSVTKQVQ